MNNPPPAEKILSILADLYADQMGVEVKYKIVDAEGKEGERSSENI